jgi:hypothetical protein
MFIGDEIAEGVRRAKEIVDDELTVRAPNFMCWCLKESQTMQMPVAS